MSWESLTEWLSQFFDKKIVLIIVGITYLLGAALIIFSKTSLGKKAIKVLTDISRETREKAQETNEKVKSVELLANEKIESLKGEYEKKVSALISIIDFYEVSVFQILEQIPNVKVQAKIREFKDSYEAKKEEINKWVTVTYLEYKESIEEQVAIIQAEKEEQIANLRSEIESLKELINSLLNSKETALNEEEREESENTDSIEEKL